MRLIVGADYSRFEHLGAWHCETADAEFNRQTTSPVYGVQRGPARPLPPRAVHVPCVG